VVAATDAGPALFAVDLDEFGRPTRESAMDRTREVGWLHLDAAPAVHLGGADAVERLVDRGSVAACAEMLGGALKVLDLSVEYAKDRVQFGRPIGSFQAVKHRCADMLVDVEGMRSTTYWAAWCLSAGDREASIAASTAKIWCADASKRVMASALQVHGGIGFTWEHDLHLFLKRAQLDQLSFGDAPFHRERLAALLRPRVEAGESVI
jgi:alkylation response protein AidB-like acyl-CoA dehydrogenase